jgi:hypothetical protein
LRTLARKEKSNLPHELSTLLLGGHEAQAERFELIRFLDDNHATAEAWLVSAPAVSRCVRKTIEWTFGSANFWNFAISPPELLKRTG